MSLRTQAPKSTTAISAVFIINIPSIGIIAHQVQGFGGDDAFSFDEVTTAEAYIGVDGQLNAGYIPQLKSMKLTLAPTSESIRIFNQWYYEMQNREETIWAASAEIVLPAVRESFHLTNGALMGYVPVMGVKKTLQPIPVRIVWDSVTQTMNA
jgi:hypothetical protein